MLLVLVVTSMLSLATFGLANKVIAQRRYDSAGDGILRAVKAEMPVIGYLEQSGATTQPLYDQLARIDEAEGAPAKARAAAEFAELVADGADGRELPDLARGHVTNLSKALGRFEDAVAHREEVRASWMARLTGEYGL